MGYLAHLAARPETAATVHEVLAKLWPGRFDAGQLADDLSLGKGGLGLDSIEIVELLLESGDRLGVPGHSAEELLEAGPISLGLLIDHLARS